MTVSTIAHTRGHPGYSETMPCAPESAATARSLIRTALGAWGLGRLEDDGELVVTEFVANAARHTDGRRIRVSVSRPARNVVRIQVSDRSRTLPVHQVATPDDTGGRGLELIDTLTTRWGTDRLPWGKRVWCECALKTTDCIPGSARKDSEEILGSSDLPGTER